MAGSLTIVGQGIAGSLLGWFCERAGVEFQIIDRGQATAASRVGAGLVSPLTGRRLVPTWRFGEWRDEALRIYREWEAEAGCSVVRELRLRRVFRDAAERARFETRCAVPEVARWVDARDDHGLWLRGTFQVDTATIIKSLRERWRATGRLTEAETTPAALAERRRVIWCTGAQADPAWAPWEVSKGEVLCGRLPGLDADTVLNDGRWIMPMGGGPDEVRVGATFVRDDLSPEPTVAGQTELQEAAKRLTGRTVDGAHGLAGRRVTVPDRRPVAGWINASRTRGILGGLAAKGALWAPILAAQWVADGLGGERIDSESRAGRYARGDV